MLRLYLYTVFFLTLIFWIAFFIFVFYFNPTKIDFLAFVIFFLDLFAALFGTFTLIGFYMRVRFSKKEVGLNMFKTSLRQGFVFAIFIIGVLIFLALKIFSWWSVSLFLVVIILIELILRAR